MAPVAVDLFSCSSIPKELVFCAEALRDFSGKQRGFSVGGGVFFIHMRLLIGNWTVRLYGNLYYLTGCLLVWS